MYEAKPPRQGDAHPLHEESWEGEALRELTWADLVARLSASRCLKGEFAPGDGDGEASFDASCARRIAAHHHGESPVNPDYSSNGKEPRPTAAPAVYGSATAFAAGAARK
jgi:hypothetical protein